MGMFDRVWVVCPLCGERIEAQSKAGPCLLRDYNLGTAPPEVLVDLGNQTYACSKGHEHWLKPRVELTYILGPYAPAGDADGDDV